MVGKQLQLTLDRSAALTFKPWGVQKLALIDYY